MTAREAVGPLDSASPLWTLQRLCFEPDVAADPSDRGENRDPGKARGKLAMQTGLCSHVYGLSARYS